MNDTLVQSVRKAMTILDILVLEDLERKGVGLFDLARKMDLKPNTLHNLLKTMAACGYVEQNTESKYIAGPKCAQIGLVNNVMAGEVLKDKIQPAMEALKDKIKESVAFAILSNGDRFPVVSINYENPIKVDLTAMERENIYEKNTGRILTAYADSDNLSLIKGKWGFPGGAWENICDDGTFEKVLADVRSKGYVKSLEEEASIVSIAVPVLDTAGRLVGAVGGYAPLFRCGDEKQEEIIEALRESAKDIAGFININRSIPNR